LSLHLKSIVSFSEHIPYGVNGLPAGDNISKASSEIADDNKY